MLMALNLVARASLECHSRTLGQASSSLAAPVLHSQHIMPLQTLLLTGTQQEFRRITVGILPSVTRPEGTV